MSNLEKRRKMHKLLCEELINYNGNRANGIPFHFDISDHIVSNPTDAPHKFSLKHVEGEAPLGNWDNLDATINDSIWLTDMTLSINNPAQFSATNQEEADSIVMMPTSTEVKQMVGRAHFKAKRGVDVDHAHISVGVDGLRGSVEMEDHEIYTDALRGGTDIEIFWYNKYVDRLR